MDTTTYLHALLLGVVEGLTEFIPVSSTGHLILITDIIGFEGPPGKVFEVAIQLGAIFAICWLYRDKLIDSATKFGRDSVATRFVFNVAIAFIPAAVLGAIFHKTIKLILFSPFVVSVSLIIGGFIIILIERSKLKVKFESVDSLSRTTSLLIGFFQSIAMIPGVSRSGATIMGAMLLGVDRKAATEFSFFLAIPTMFGATVYDIYKNYDLLNADSFSLIAVGFMSAFISALIVVKHVINFVANHGFIPFAYYRIILGSSMLFLLYNVSL